MPHRRKTIWLSVMIGLLSGALLSGCGPGQSQPGETVPVNLSLVLENQEARSQSGPSKFVAFVQEWILGLSTAWAQAASEIATIQVQVSGPEISIPVTETVSVPPDSTSGTIIPVSIQAPVGPNRTIYVAGFNAAGRKLFSGSQVVHLAAGTPANVTITLVRTFTVTVQKQGTGNGTVTSSPAGIDCGGTCSSQFDDGTSAALTAAAEPESTFAGWSGGGCSGTGSCTVTTNATVAAIFNSAVGTARLTVTKSGTGTGTVTSNPSGINCGDGCTANFTTRSSVSLTAAPSGGSTFAGWSGACSGTGPCTVVMNGNQTVTAQFTAAPTELLTVTKTGNGTVTSTPAGISCGATCSAGFASGSTVTLTAVGTGGSTFSGWGGACSGAGSCAVTMNGNQTVSASFTPPVATATLTVTTAGTGAGSVSSSPAGINSCSATCTADFTVGTSVTLTPAAAGGSAFSGWSGACTGTGACVVVMSADQSVTATFTAEPTTATLTVTKTGAGTGMVSSTPAGINSCASTCSAGFTSGSPVTLTPTATDGSTFAGWSGACSGTGSCEIVMNGNQSVTATFNPPVATATLTVSKTGPGSGTVTSSPAGINCGPTCSASFASGTSVTLTAASAEGATFMGWSGGGCGGTGTCTTVMSDSQTVVAQFETTPNVDTLTVSKTGTGSGTVTSSPSGINCGTTCTFSFTSGTEVTLTATPELGSVFAGWSGSGCSGTDATCVVEVDRNRTVTATFDMGIP